MPAQRAGLTLRRYYFLLGTPKRITYQQIREFRAQPMGWLTGKGRAWGTAHPGYWLSLDLTRPRKDTVIVLAVGAHVKSAFTRDHPDLVLEVLRERVPR